MGADNRLPRLSYWCVRDRVSQVWTHYTVISSVYAVLLGYEFLGEGRDGAMTGSGASGLEKLLKEGEGSKSFAWLMKQTDLWRKIHTPSLMDVLTLIASL